MAISIGDKLGPYEILAPIGAGGMGEVWKARDTRLDRIVAVKLLKEGGAARFAREARAIAALNHPNICQIFDVGPDYLVMEYIEGQPLRGPVPTEEAVRLAIQIAGALETAHQRGILHRDLKPGNILVSKSGAKLLDFGLAKIAQTGSEEDETAHTIEGSIMGTAAYMSPEQAQGKAVDERSDLFSFGAVLYEMVAGRRAFGGASLADTLSAVMRDMPAPIEGPIGAIVSRCLAKAPAQRYSNMTEVRGELEKIAAGKPSKPLPSIAVLPFANMSRDADDEYFSDGLAEEILNLLAQIPGLKVIARTSSFAFRGREQDIRRIAEALGVTTVLEGSVRRAGNRMRVTAQLISSEDGAHLWSKRYDCEVKDIFEVQDEISAAIADALQVALALKPDGATREHEPNLPAYEEFLKGRHAAQTYSAESFARACTHFRNAIALDPKWALPHAFLGMQISRPAALGACPMSDMVAASRLEELTALELSPSEPVAHSVLGVLAALHDYDWQEAANRFRLAMASEPIPPIALDGYAEFYLLPRGRFDEALQIRAKVIAQDPLNSLWRGRQAKTFAYAGRYAEAIAEGLKAIEIDREDTPALFAIATACINLGRLDEARDYARRLLGSSLFAGPAGSGPRCLQAAILARSGEREQAEQLVADIRSKDPMNLAVYRAYCSEIDVAIDCYEEGIRQHQALAAVFASRQDLAALRAHPRWPALARMMNLPSI